MNEVDYYLKHYIENNIFPKYKNNDLGHQVDHVKSVIDRSFKLSTNLCDKLNSNIIYTVAAFHDLGIQIDRKKHEIISAIMCYEDEFIRRYFSSDNRIIIKEAIEDHRASLKGTPRSIYGKVVSSADRSIDVNDIIIRAYEGIKKNGILMNGVVSKKELARHEILEVVYEHLIDKYGQNGYAKCYIIDKDYTDFLNNIRDILKDKNKFDRKCKVLIK